MALAQVKSRGSPTLMAQKDVSFTTKVLINNIHCPSCVTHIEKTLAELWIPARQISVNILNQEVQIQNTAPATVPSLCAALSDAAFEVHSACTIDQTGTVLSELDFQADHHNWLDGATGLWPQTQRTTRNSKAGQSRTNSQVKDRHLEYCSACKMELKQEPGAASHRSKSIEAIARPDPATVSGANIAAVGAHQEKAFAENTRVEGQSDASNVPWDTLQPDPSSSCSFTLQALTLSIGGMTCVSCSNAIKQAVQGHDFVTSIEVDLMTNSAQVQFTGNANRTESIVDTINDIGYDAHIVDCKPLQSDATRSTMEPSYKATLSISGMTCGSCVTAIARGLRELPFIKRLNVNLISNGGDVVYTGKDSLALILEKIDELGYVCTVVNSNPFIETARPSRHSDMRTIQLKINGMFCNHCPPRITEALQTKFPGLVNIDQVPTLKDPLMTLTYMPTTPRFTVRNIISTINATSKGLHTQLYHPPSVEDRSRSMLVHEKYRMMKRLILSFVVAIPTFLIGVVWMSLVPTSNRVRQWFTAAVWSGNATRAEWALFVLATPVMFLAADVFHVRAIKEIRALWRKGSKAPLFERFYRFGSMNLLISAGTSVAYFSSIALLIINATAKDIGTDTGTYFDSVVFLTFFILIGRNIEAYSKSKTSDTVATLGSLRPNNALLVLASEQDVAIPTDNEQDEIQPTRIDTIDATLLEIDDLVVVPHGSSPPADGLIVLGWAELDESSLTGESRPVRKGPGETVFVGTLNTGSPITMRIVKTGGTSLLDQIVAVVREGQTKRAPVERLADILTGYFVPVITGLAIITFLVWVAIGQSGVLDPRYLNGQAGGWPFWSLEFAIAVFVVACPCGIGLAAPTALFVGGGLAAKHGVLVRGGGEAFQEAGNLDAIVFDKTGTLTEGNLVSVTDHEMLTTEEGQTSIAWSIVKSMEEQSTHPIARAILKLAYMQTPSEAIVDSISEESGRGVRSIFHVPSRSGVGSDAYEAALGSEAMISSLESSPPTMTYYISQTLSRWRSQAKSIAILATRPLGQLAVESKDFDTQSTSSVWTIDAIFALSDPVRPSALPAIQSLQARGLAVYMLSGDNPSTALAVGSSLGIPAANIFAGVLPSQKAEKIEWLQAHGPKRARPANWLWHLGISSSRPPRKAKIAFVGDGINDSPALHAADVSISLSSGSPIAHSSSSFILLTSSLLTVPLLLDLSSRVFRRIRFNFAWALGYNLCLVPVAAGVLFAVNGGGWRLGPVWASAAMACSSVSVVTSSLLLRWEWSWKSWRTGERTDLIVVGEDT